MPKKRTARVGESMLASLEGTDPDVAIARARSRYTRDRKWLVFGVSITTDLEPRPTRGFRARAA